MTYSVKLTKRAVKDLERLDKVTQARLRERLKILALAPLDPYLSYPLEMAKEKRSSRVGDWRIIFQVNEASFAIEVLSIDPRGKAYRKL